MAKVKEMRWGTAPERFWNHVTKGEACWKWNASLTNKGYGRIHVGKERLLAHRYSWMLHFGPIPDGKHVLHTCDNPACVNPSHLFLGTHQDNMADKVAKGRHYHFKFTAKQIKKMISMRRRGFPLKSIAEEFNVYRGVIRRVLEEQKVYSLTQLADIKRDPIRADIQKIILRREKNGEALRTIAKDYGVDKCVVKYVLLEHNAYTRVKPGPISGRFK